MSKMKELIFDLITEDQLMRKIEKINPVYNIVVEDGEDK